jgi:hypothetical protein
MKWEQYLNSKQGATAYVVGKGPTLDKWRKDGCPKEPGAVVLGCNDVGNYVDVDYTFTTDGYARVADKGVRFLGLPYRTESGEKSHHKKKGDEWFLHCHDIRRDGCAARQTMAQLAETRWLYTASSSVQPAIHFARYLGCAKLFLVGVDGVGGYAQGVSGTADTAEKYAMLRRDTVQISNAMFGKHWRDLYAI